ncbi:MAG: hypothetical protein VX438_03340 [Planctomycetota bacterium]|nr:hypothetical protein [Planctomycetota bacterium]
MEQVREPSPVILVSGGRQRQKALDLPEWQAYECGVIVAVDGQTLKPINVVEYQTPPQYCSDQLPSIVFKAGDLSKDSRHLLVCTQTEILEYDTRSWEIVFHYTHPSFNDLHHVCYQGEDTVLVANTGLDQILKLRRQPQKEPAVEIVESWSTGSKPTWEKFDLTTDYRKISTTKPHETHPNFIFSHRGKHYATRFHQQDALDLHEPEFQIKIAAGNPHDGVVRAGRVTFTTTNGNVCVFELESGNELSRINLNSIHNPGGQLGWCRGLCHENDSWAWVGFSRIRPTRFRQNLSWIKQGFKSKGTYGTRPTRIAKYDLQEQILLQEVDLETVGVNAIFGIYCQRPQAN